MDITINEALVKIKTTEARINKAISSVPTLKTVINTDNISLIDNKTSEAFTSDIQANFDSVLGLLDNVRTLKSLVAQSNATSKLIIAGKEYTVTEAINRKHTEGINLSYISKLNQMLSHNDAHITSILETNRKRMIEAITASDKEDNTEITEKFKLAILDPHNIADKIRLLEEDSVKFMEEVDIKLNNHNATTVITIPD